MKWTHAVAFALLAVGLAGCSKPKQVQPDTTAQAPVEGGAQTSGLGNETGPATGATAGAMSAAQQQALAALQSRNVVFFEFDSSEIRADYLSVVAAHAAYLTKFRPRACGSKDTPTNAARANTTSASAKGAHRQCARR